MDVNFLRTQPLPVWSTFVISNVRHKCSRNTRWKDTWTQSRTQEPSWVFSSLSSTCNPSSCSFLKCIFIIPFSPLPCPFLLPGHSLHSLEDLKSNLWTLPSVTLFLCILHQSARLLTLKPNQIKCFCCLNLVFQLFHLLSCSSVTCVHWYFLFPPSFYHMPLIHHMNFSGLLSFFNIQPPSHLKDCSLWPEGTSFPLGFQFK